ncbi:MAG TPA: HAD family hydrolase [Caulobacteraceae bacterium]|jgi:D-glycero-D-manno-heptose 1,7-bisphosphate phosphatase|nr:HAD family hydrolase [Caulobacteraceae bacterium]
MNTSRDQPANLTRGRGKTSRRAVILDRDGVLNHDHGYVGHADRWSWIEGARRAVRRLNDAGVLVIIATNQSGVARGFFTETDVSALHGLMEADLAAEGARVDAVYVCPFHSEATQAHYAHPDHPDRKPNPGMILRALADFHVAADQAVVIGDKESDLEAARRAGVRALKFDGGNLDAFVCRQLADLLAK